MQRPPSILVLALVSAISGLVFLANSFTGNNNNGLISSISNPLDDSQRLLPIANALKKDLMLDVSPQLHPSTVVGQSAKQIKFQHWIDNEIHCEDCLRLEIPNNGQKAGAAFSSDGAVYNFEGAKKVRFYVMGEEPGAKVNFKAVGNDKAKTTGGNAVNNNSSNNKNGAANNNLFKDQEFALSSQNVTLNQTWGYHEMGLEGAEQKLSKVKYPFALEVEQGKGKTTTIIYIKGIEYSDEPVQDQYSLEPSSSNTTASTLAMTAATTTTALNIMLIDNATVAVNAPATIEFNATLSNGQQPYSFDWDFKDGAKEADTDGNIMHTFATPGLYNVTVNVVDSMNNTGSASTLVDVADQIVEDQPAIASTEDNSTQDSQSPNVANIDNTTQAPTDADNETEGADVSDGNSTTTTAADQEPSGLIEGTNADNGGSTNDTENINANTGTGIDTQSDSVANNSPPIANAGNDLIGKPNGQVILDASKSSDPDAGDTIVSYQWEQKSGPAAEINDQASPTPIVTLPDVDEDSTIVFSLTVNDGSIDSEEEDTVSIVVDYVDELANDVQQRVLKPADITASEWIPSGNCEGQSGAECLSDGSDATFVAAGTEGIGSVNLYSFGEFSEQQEGAAAPIDPNSVVIDRVVAEITAKKIGNTGYVSFAVDDPRDEEHYFTPSLSIASSSFQKYNYVWDTNPVTGELWTHDSLNSLVAGFKYDGGQSGVQTSELQLTVSYHSPTPEAAPVTEPAPSNDQDTTGDASDNVANEDEEENDENGTNDVRDTEQDEAAIEADGTKDNTADTNDPDGEDSSQSEE